MFCNRIGAGGYGVGGTNFFMMIPLLIVVLLVAYLIYREIKSKNSNFVVDKSSSEAIDILNTRFAKGEISEEEYTSKKKQIIQS